MIKYFAYLTAFSVTLAIDLFGQDKISLNSTFDLVFIGDSITAGVGVFNPDMQAAPVIAAQDLQRRFGNWAKVYMSAQGYGGATTVDYLPGSLHFYQVADAAKVLEASHAGQLVFSVMLGTNDSANSGTNGSPVSGADYAKNLGRIIDKLLNEFPGCKFIVNHPIWYSPNTHNSADYEGDSAAKRLKSYFPAIDSLVVRYGASNPHQVFVGDTQGYVYFVEHSNELTGESGRNGVFHLHPNIAGARSLGGFWAAALADKLRSGLATAFDALAADEPLLANSSGEPPNTGARIEWSEMAGTLQLRYDGKLMFDGHLTGTVSVSDVTTLDKDALTQTLRFVGKKLRLEGVVSAADEGITAETAGPVQQRFPLVRTTNGGPSRNLRNNAVYDRGRDWMLAGPNEGTRLYPQSPTRFEVVCCGNDIELTFKPRFYQRHKNITWFRPWTYEVRKDSITGWCSWWAFTRGFRQSDLDQLLTVWKEKRFADYGYRFVQIDDCYEGGDDAGHHSLPAAGGICGNPATWLDWRRDTFPSGINGYVTSVKRSGFEPGVWMSSGYSDTDVAAQHPDWFVRDAGGKPFVGPWIGYAIDSTQPEAMRTLVRPTFRGLNKAGFVYVKIDTLRHYLYDNLNHNLDYCYQRGLKPTDLFRRYLSAAREELGPNTFILSCWGVLPESVGLADACRIGGDGYGPATMQQYNSWNGIVWRNDPDHCDVYPRFKSAQAGNVTQTASVAAAPADTIIRPALASIAGCLLMLSDKPEVYRDDANLEGLRRAAPVLFSVPGQLYDFDSSKSRNVVCVPRTDINSGKDPSPIDASRLGSVCPWWLNEFNRPFEDWVVLHHLNWSNKPAGPTNIDFTSLGLDPTKTYLVYEFWSHKYLGGFCNQIALPGIKPMGLDSFAIREQLAHPQVVSTGRHLSQGGVDLVSVEWNNNILQGRSRVIKGDRYELAVSVPPEYALVAASFGEVTAERAIDSNLARVAFTPVATGEVTWRLSFHTTDTNNFPRPGHAGVNPFAHRNIEQAGSFTDR